MDLGRLDGGVPFILVPVKLYDAEINRLGIKIQQSKKEGFLGSVPGACGRHKSDTIFHYVIVVSVL